MSVFLPLLPDSVRAAVDALAAKPLTASDLAAKLGLSREGAAKIIRKLERSGAAHAVAEERRAGGGAPAVLYALTQQARTEMEMAAPKVFARGTDGDHGRKR